jgi:hypothetical protein
MTEMHLNLHPALVAALQGLADHEKCSLDELVVRLIRDGLTVRLKISEISVLRQHIKKDE